MYDGGQESLKTCTLGFQRVLGMHRYVSLVHTRLHVHAIPRSTAFGCGVIHFFPYIVIDDSINLGVKLSIERNYCRGVGGTMVRRRYTGCRWLGHLVVLACRCLDVPGLCLRMSRTSLSSCRIALTLGSVCAPRFTVLYQSRMSGRPHCDGNPCTILKPTSASFFW